MNKPSGIDDLPTCCTEQDVAKFLNIKASSVRTLCTKGIMPHRRINLRYRIMKEDLLEYLENVKCQGKIAEPALNGDQKETSGKSFGMSRVREKGNQRALQTARKLIKNSRHSI